MPFWKVEAKYTLSADTLEEVISNSISSADATLTEDIDFEEIVGKKGTELNLTISLETSDILKSFNASPKRLVENIITKNVDKLYTQLEDTLNLLIKNTLTAVVKTTFAGSIKEEIKNTISSVETDSEASEELKKAGVTDKYLEDKTNNLVDLIYKKGSTSASVVNETLTIVDETIAMMKENNPEQYGDLSLEGEARTDLETELLDYFGALENEDGTLNPEGFTADFLATLLEGTDSDTSAVTATPISAKATSKKSAESDASEELREVLTDKLLEVIGDATETLATIIKVLGYVIIATFIIWALPIVKIALKFNNRNNAIKLSLPIWWGSIPYVVLCLFPTLFFAFMKTPPEAIASAMGGLDLLNGFSITFSSCAIVSFIVGIALAVLVLFFYGKQRKILKKGGGYAQTTQSADTKTVSENTAE
ncbi:MAG: hypothetical protein J6S04_00705 [Clostridia bacterium]|nr:hypothetical protein [Clostridia bacterium]